MHLVKLCHLDLPCYLGLTPTSKGVGLIPVVDFPSGPRFCHSILPSHVFWPNHRLCLVWNLGALRPTFWAPFLKPSFTNTYVVCEHVKPKVEPNPTLGLVTQVATGAPLWWFRFGSKLGEPPHLRVCLEKHVNYHPTHLPFSHNYRVNLHLAPTCKLTFNPPTYPLYLATLYHSLTKSLSLSKSSIYFWLNLYLLEKPLFLFSKIVIYFWPNLYPLEKPLFFFSLNFYLWTIFNFFPS
jgi:hypothetical protein